MKTGSIVEDKEPQYDGVGVVVNLTDNLAHSVEISGTSQTVAELNPNYDPESKVAEICFVNNLKGKMPTWWMMSEDQFKSEVEKLNVKKYYYPITRLEYLREGLINGVIIRVTGVADPFSHTNGAYTFEASRINSEISYTESKFVNQYDKVTKTTATMVGILESLKWVEKRGRNEGVQIVVEDKDIIRKINGEYNLRSKTTKKLIGNIQKASETLPKVEYRNAPKGQNKNLKDKAVQEYKESETSNSSTFEIDRVVDEEYIVDGIFSVNLDQNKCTCEQDEPCKHIKAVESQVMN